MVTCAVYCGVGAFSRKFISIRSYEDVRDRKRAWALKPGNAACIGNVFVNPDLLLAKVYGVVHKAFLVSKCQLQKDKRLDVVRRHFRQDITAPVQQDRMLANARPSMGDP